MANTRLSPEQANEILRRHMERQSPGREAAQAKQSWRPRVLSYAPGESVLHADAQGGQLCLVVQGQLGVYTTERQDGHPLVILTPGKTFGRTTPRLSPPNATLRALTRCEIWFLEPVGSAGTAGSKERGAQAVRRPSRLVRLVPVLLIVWVAALLLVVPSTRAALGVLPMGLGDWCQQHGHTWCAKQAWSAAGIMAPLDAGPALAQGMLAVQQDDLEEAEAAFEKARAVAPNSPEAVNNLGVVYYRRGEYVRAAAAFRQALLVEPGNASAEQNLGDSLLAVDAYDEALSHYRTALGLGGSRGRTLAGMAIAYYQTGQLPDAEDAARSALRAQPNLPAAYLVLGAVALESQQPEEALSLLSRAKELKPAAGEIDYYLGLAYLAVQQPANAAASFRQALAQTSDEEMRAEIDRHLAALQGHAAEGTQP